MEAVPSAILAYAHRDFNSLFRGVLLNMNREIKTPKNTVNRIFKVPLNMFLYTFRKIGGYQLIIDTTTRTGNVSVQALWEPEIKN